MDGIKYMYIKKERILNFNDKLCFLFILTMFIFDNSSSLVYISNITSILFIASIFISKIITKKKLLINFYIKYYYIMLIILSIPFIIGSVESLDYFIVQFMTLIKILILCFAVLNYIDNDKKNIEKIIKYIAISGLMLSIYFIATSYNDLLTATFEGETRFGRQIGNVNAVGLLVAISFIIYVFYCTRKLNIVNISACIINFIVIALTGSRKSIMMVIIGIILIIYQKNNKNIISKAKFALQSILVSIVILYTVFNSKILYAVIGKRLNYFIEAFISGEAASYSDQMRLLMINIGIDRFFEKPIFGYGLDNYRVLLNNHIGIETYSHNNFIELLISGGIIGFVIYYIIIAFIIKKLYKYKNSDIAIPILTCISAILILSIGMVTIRLKIFYILLTIGSVIIKTSSSEIEVN